MIKFCSQCRKNNSKEYGCVGGYFWGLKDEISLCPVKNCNNNLIDIDFDPEDFFVLKNISEDYHFLDSMIDLHDKDIIEYELKMSQFRNQVEQQKTIQNTQQQTKESNKPKCPTCQSTNIKKISGISKAGSAAMFGILSRKVHKQWHCNNCGSEW